MAFELSLSKFKELKVEFWKELQSYYHDGLYTDLEIVGATQQKISCHKLTLASVSETFKTLLTSVADDEVTKVLIPELDVMELDIYLKDLYSCLAGGKEYDTINVSNNLISLFHLKQLNKENDIPVWNGEDVKIKIEDEVQVHDFYTDIELSSPLNIQGDKRKMDWEMEEMSDHDIDQFDLEDVEGMEQEAIVRPRKKIKQADTAEASVEDPGYLAAQRKLKKVKPKRTKAVERKEKLKIAESDESLINTEIKINVKDKPDEYFREVFDIHERRKIYSLLKESDAIISVQISTEQLNYKQGFRYQDLGSIKKKPYFMAVVGIVNCDPRSEVQGKPLAWSFPYAVDIDTQFDNIFSAFQSVFGFSDADICYHTLMYARQGKYRQNKDSKVRHAMRREYASLSDDELKKLLNKPDVIGATKRYPRKPDMVVESSEMQICLNANLSGKDMDGVLILTWRDEDQVEARVVHVEEDGMDDARKYLMTMVFDVWTLERNILNRRFIPDSPYLCKRHDDFLIPIETLTVAQEYLNDVDRKMRNEILDNTKICPDCGRVFSCVTVNEHLTFNQHKRLHYYEKFQCNCSYQSSSIRDKMMHVKTVHESDNYEKCKYCDHVTNKKFFALHKCVGKIEAGEHHERMLISLKERTLKSSFEKPTFTLTRKARAAITSKTKKVNDDKQAKKQNPAPKTLAKHVKEEKKEEIFGFICCNEQFENFFSVSNHVKSAHTPDKNVQCGKCNYFGTTRSVHYHQTSVHKPKGEEQLDFVCEICGKAKKSKGDLNAHISNFHVTRNCHLCHMEFSIHTSLKYHLKKVHNIGRPAACPCEICGKEFSTKSRLKHHFMRIHMEDKERPHHCDQCGRGFALKASLATHQMQAHIKARPFKCRYGCGADYNDHASRGTHELKKHGKRLTIKDEVGKAEFEAN